MMRLVFPHQLLLTRRQVTNVRKPFDKNSSADIKLSKTHSINGYNHEDFLVDFVVHY